MEVTDNAIQKLKDVLVDVGAVERSIRIFTSGPGCCGPSLRLDVSTDGEPGDQLIEKDGLKLFVSPDAYDVLSAATIDYVDSKLRITGTGSSCCD
jgi:iron-sulfur cluster assembly accessory protein